MEQVGPEAEGSEKREERSPSLARLIAIWARVVIGLALVGEGGVLFADARMRWAGHGAWMGVAAMVVGALVGLSGLYAICAQARRRAPGDEDELLVAPEAAVPMLGALLVYKYQFITEEQLTEALEIQRKAGHNRPRIGTILLEMGVLTMAQLQEALAHQRSLAIRDGRAAILESVAEGEEETRETPVAAQ